MSLSVAIHADAGEFSLDVHFSMNGRSMALLGASGAGKTLTLRAIAGLLKPRQGMIELDGAKLFSSADGISVPVRNRRVGYVFQDYALFPHLTVEQNIAFGLRGRPKDEVGAAVSRMVQLLRLGGLVKRHPATLSGGERQRVALGRALAPEPRLLLLDEPFSALDMPTRSALTEEFVALRAEIDVPTLLVTHDVGEAYAICDELTLVDQGSVLQTGDKRQVFSSPGSPAAARLVGMQNLVRGRVVSVAKARSTIDAGGLRIEAPTHLETGSEVQAAFRAIDAAATPSALGNATLERVVDRGTQLIGILRLPDGQSIEAVLDRIATSTPGNAFEVAVGPSAATVWPIA